MANEYNYLSQSNCMVIDGVDDALNFHKLQVFNLWWCEEFLLQLCPFPQNIITITNHVFSPQDALDTVRIGKEDQERIFATLAAVLWLGNISFQVVDNENHIEVVTDEGNYSMF